MQKRREQRWVSHNKVLIGSGDGGSKKPHARNPNFDSEETKLLIQIWGDPQVQRTLITIHKKHPVIAKIAESMRSYGYMRSTEEINTRIKNLKCLYNRIKKDLDSGLLNEPSWKHFHAMDEILSRPVFGNNNAAVNKIPVTNKIVISPSSLSDGDQLLQVKEEEMSDEDIDDEQSSMDYEGNELLRPEDLLSVVDADDEKHESDVQVKDEPMDIATIVETKKTDKPDSSTSNALPNSKKEEESKSTTKDIINYPNDSLSITSVQGNNQQLQQTSTNLIQVSQIPLSSSTATGVSNKISLVPTKLLLKTQSGFVPTTSASITTNAQSSIPMKVVFVNAINHPNAQQAGNNQQQITLNKTLAQHLQSPTNPTFITTNKLIGHTQTTKVQLVSQLPSPNYTTATISNLSSNNIAKVSVATSSNGHHKNSHDSSSSTSSSTSRKSKSSKSLLGSNKLPVIRNLLTNIVEIENQRLDIEKQRFEYEKRVGNEILSLLKSFMNNSSPPSSSSSPKTKAPSDEVVNNAGTSNGV